MLGLNPVGPMGITKFGSFDFPLGLQADTCKGNVDPGPHLPLIEEWYGKMGTPPRQQGWPCIMEHQPGVEDPGVAPWIDLLIHDKKRALIFNTGRLSGDMALELADDTHNSVVTVHAVPYKTGNAVPLYNKSVTLQPQPTKAPDVWFWHSETELIYTLMVDFVPEAKKLAVGEVYKLLVEWEFYHTIPANGKKHLEPFAGFDDSITFKIIGDVTL
jgi:hypothetical protein